MADKRIDQLVAATTLGNNDFLVLEQNNQAKKLSGATLASFVYNAATDKIAEVNQAVADAQDAVDSLEEQKNTIAESIASMADLGTDTTLSTTGMAADAKATGDRINDAETAALAGLDQGKIEGVAVASFDDGADDVPVKSLKIAIEPQQDLHGYANPWPAGGNTNLLPITATSQTVSGVTFVVNKDAAGNAISITASGTATEDIAYTVGSMTATGNTLYLAGTPSTGSSETYFLFGTYLGTDTRSGINGTPAAGNTVTVSIRIDNGTALSNVVFKPIVSETLVGYSGFVPYSNMSPITGWTEAKITKTGKNIVNFLNWGLTYKPNFVDLANKVISWYSYDNLEPFTKGVKFKENTRYTFILRLYRDTATTAGNTYGSNLAVGYTDGSYTSITYKSAGSAVYVNTVFKSDPNKTIDRLAIFNASGRTYLKYEESGIFEGDVDVSDFEAYRGAVYDVSFPSESGEVFGGTLDVVSRVLTVDHVNLVLTSEKQMNYTGAKTLATRFSFNCPSAVFNSDRGRYAISSVFQHSWADALGWGANSVPYKYGVYNSIVYFTLPLEINTVEKCKSWIDSQGGSIQFLAQLKEPITYTLTNAEVRTFIATNNIWADSGDIEELIYRKKPVSDSDIKESVEAIRETIADREDNGIASKNYAAGSLVLVGERLLETTGSIATGETLAVGTNCQETTVSEQIAYLKNIVNSINNMAYLSYEIV